MKSSLWKKGGEGTERHPAMFTMAPRETTAVESVCLITAGCRFLRCKWCLVDWAFNEATQDTCQRLHVKQAREISEGLAVYAVEKKIAFDALEKEAISLFSMQTNTAFKAALITCGVFYGCCTQRDNVFRDALES